MRAAGSLSDFVAAPVGTAFTSRTFLICVPTPERITVTHLGMLDPTEVPMLGEFARLPGATGLAPHYDILYDVGDVTAMDRETFRRFDEFVRATIDLVAVRVRRLGVVKPPGLTGVLFTGMIHSWLAPKLGDVVTMFDDRDGAYAWFEVPAPERDELETAIVGFTHRTATVRRMYALLQRGPCSTLETIATELGMSPRSLQRHLGSLGTSFREQSVKARIELAEALLADTDDKVEAIAVTLGFKSVAAFTTSFRTAVGVTPASYRDARRM